MIFLFWAILIVAAVTWGWFIVPRITDSLALGLLLGMAGGWGIGAILSLVFGQWL